MKIEKIYDCDVLDSSKTYFGLPKNVDRLTTDILISNYSDDLIEYAKEKQKLLVLNREINKDNLIARKYTEFFGCKDFHREDVYFLYDQNGRLEKFFHYASPQSLMKTTLFEYTLSYKDENCLIECRVRKKDGERMSELAGIWESQNNAFVFL